MSQQALVNVAHRGSFLCGGWELRVTGRCREEDLGAPAGLSFEELATRYPIVRAFRNRRHDRTDDSKEVAPLTQGRTVHRLAHGHDHRGATWWDPANRVVWLCAYRRHRSGAPDDAFPYFKALEAEGRLFPLRADYRDLGTDREHRLVDALPTEVHALLARARQAPGVEHAAIIGGSTGVAVVVEVVETLEETYVAVPASTSWITLLLAAFFPDSEAQEWESANRLPTRELHNDEVAFRFLAG